MQTINHRGRREHREMKYSSLNIRHSVFLEIPALCSLRPLWLIIRYVSLLALVITTTLSAETATEQKFGQSEFELFERANTLYREGRYVKALLLYQKAGKRGIDPSAVAFNIGNCHYRLDRMPQAAAAFKKAARSSAGKNTSALFNLAGVLFRLEQYGECVAVYRRALKREADNISAWLYLSDAYARTGDLVGAQKALEQAHLLEPDDVSILYQLAEIHMAMKEHEAAVKIIRDAYARKPSEIDFLFYIGDVNRARASFESAASAYREGLAFRPRDHNVLYKLADVLYRNNQPFLAMEYLQKALSVKPDFSDAAIFLGNLAFDHKWWDRAESNYLLSLKSGNREGLEGLRNLAYEYRERGETEKSILILEKALPFAAGNRNILLDLQEYRQLADR